MHFSRRTVSPVQARYGVFVFCGSNPGVFAAPVSAPATDGTAASAIVVPRTGSSRAPRPRRNLCLIRDSLLNSSDESPAPRECPLVVPLWRANVRMSWRLHNDIPDGPAPVVLGGSAT